MKHQTISFQLVILMIGISTGIFSQNIELEGIPGQSGLTINTPGLHGIEITNPVDDGIRIINAQDIGAFISGAKSYAGFFTTDGSLDESAVYIQNGNNLFPDLELAGGLISSHRGLGLELDRFNSLTEYEFSIMGNGNTIYTLDEDGDAAYGDFMLINTADETMTLKNSEIGVAILFGAKGSANEPFIEMRRSDGTSGIYLDVDDDGDSRITTDELEIKGGSDLAENFDVSAHPGLKPGTVVSIDPKTPGQLTVSDISYDKKVAGIISGAKGIQSGMIMGQSGSIADGAFPVALAGRVYALADATMGEINPGDLLTTSNHPGHVMKATKHKKAQGAIVGKAMTSLKEGYGHVLVLINLQ